MNLNEVMEVRNPCEEESPDRKQTAAGVRSRANCKLFTIIASEVSGFEDSAGHRNKLPQVTASRNVKHRRQLTYDADNKIGAGTSHGNRNKSGTVSDLQRGTMAAR